MGKLLRAFTRAAKKNFLRLRRRSLSLPCRLQAGRETQQQPTKRFKPQNDDDVGVKDDKRGAAAFSQRSLFVKTMKRRVRVESNSASTVPYHWKDDVRCLAHNRGIKFPPLLMPLMLFSVRI